MPFPPDPLRRLLACALLVLLSTQSTAQQARWYKVELMVFSHTGGQFAEQWDPMPTLTYPDAVQRLRAKPGSDNDQAPPPPIPNGDPNFDLGQPVLPTPFVRLPASAQDFRGKAAYMARSGRYRMLFHETWVQPVTGKKWSRPILLDDSGDTGQWPDLQGTVNLYLSRYLHLETNLWLNTQADYFPGTWRMPAPPLGPATPQSMDETSPGATPPGAAVADSATGNLPAASEQAVPDTTLLSEDGVIDAGEDMWATTEQMGLESLEPVYPYRHAIPLQQKRRMRSSEIHYLDHPVLGVVVRLTPLSLEDLEAMANLETQVAARVDCSHSDSVTAMGCYGNTPATP